VPLCSTTGATSSIDRTSMVTFLLPVAPSGRLRPVFADEREAVGARSASRESRPS
jgi:hypothetical protein